MRYIFRALLPGVLGFAVAVLVAACGGGSGLLSASQATNLNGQLNAVADAINSGQCSTAGNKADSFNNSVSNLSGVNPTIVNNLEQASNALANQAQSDCDSAETAPTTPVKTKTKTSTTPTTTTRTTPTQTSAATTATTAPPPDTTTTSAAPPETTTSTTGTTNTSGGAGLTDTGTGTGIATIGTGGVPAPGAGN